jgi:hypothetical protein
LMIIGESLKTWKQWWTCSKINGVVSDYCTLKNTVSLVIILKLTFSLRPNAISKTFYIQITKFFTHYGHKRFSVQFTA